MSTAEVTPNRFIPARAGNAMALSPFVNPAVHPRACGERRQHHVAGAALVSVHPRACGERSAAMSAAIASDGSSPRVRGGKQCQVAPLRRHSFLETLAARACAGEWSTASPRITPERTLLCSCEDIRLTL